MNVVYIGYFRFRQETAAAQFFSALSQLSCSAGYPTIIIDIVTDENTYSINKNESYLGTARLITLSYPKSLWGNYCKKMRYSEIRGCIPDNSIIMFYNFSSVIMLKSLICKKQNLFVPIITEWYSPGEISGLKSALGYIIKSIDIAFRMRIVGKMGDGIIVCSSYLRNYYRSYQNILTIPIAVDYKDEKWYQDILPYDQNVTSFVYAGSPGKKKDNLSKIVHLIDKASENHPYIIRIVGLTNAEFLELHPDDTDITSNKNCLFMGRMSNKDCLRIVLSSDYSILYRDRNRVTNAGFPMKFAESMACGTPVIATDTSDIKDYITDGKNGLVLSFDEDTAISQLKKLFHKPRADREKIRSEIREMKLFDYRSYITPFKEFIAKIGK